MDDWGLGIGDWGLGIGDWAQSPIPNPQSPIYYYCNYNIIRTFIFILNFLIIYTLFRKKKCNKRAKET